MAHFTIPRLGYVAKRILAVHSSWTGPRLTPIQIAFVQTGSVITANTLGLSSKYGGSWLLTITFEDSLGKGAPLESKFALAPAPEEPICNLPSLPYPCAQKAHSKPITSPHICTQLPPKFIPGQNWGYTLTVPNPVVNTVGPISLIVFTSSYNKTFTATIDTTVTPPSATFSIPAADQPLQEPIFYEITFPQGPAMRGALFINRP